ncbi:MAG: hypothetical protein GX044_10815 [Firmicutes bacterium]|nr:hypothetical protein [Bacillota bacterium]
MIERGNNRMSCSAVSQKITVRKLIAVVALLTVLDILLTVCGMQCGYLEELNPLMKILLESNHWFLFLPPYFTLLFGLLYRFAGRVTWLGGAMFALVAIKTAVLVQHLSILLNVFSGC